MRYSPQHCKINQERQPRAPFSDMPDADIRLATHIGALVDVGYKNRKKDAFQWAIEIEQ